MLERGSIINLSNSSSSRQTVVTSRQVPWVSLVTRSIGVVDDDVGGAPWVGWGGSRGPLHVNQCLRRSLAS